MKDVLTPPSDSLHRRLFEAEFRREDEGLLRYISLGAQIEVARYELHLSARTPEELHDRYMGNYQQWLTGYAQTQVEHIGESRSTSSATALRTRLLCSLLDPLVCIPGLFNFELKDSLAYRQQIVETDGIYGSIMEVLEEVVADLNPDEHDADGRGLVGLATELTGLGMTNRDQNPAQVGLPTLPYHDILEAVDMETYLGVNGLRSIRKSQFKSGRHVLPDTSSSSVKVISGIALGNSQWSRAWPRPESLKTAKAMIADVAGTISIEDEVILDNLTTQLTRAIRTNNHFTARDGEVQKTVRPIARQREPQASSIRPTREC